MEKEHEKELLNPERELTMEDLVRFREMCRLENIITRFRDQKGWRPSPEDWVCLYWVLDRVYDRYTIRLQELIYLTDKELKIACLTKAKIPPTVISWLLSPARRRISR